MYVEEELYLAELELDELDDEDVLTVALVSPN